jgi:hypothetical protein
MVHDLQTKPLDGRSFRHPLRQSYSQTLADIDLFDQQDLRAYAANAHHCMLRAVTELMEYLHQDPSKLDRASKGFFGLA